MALTTKEFLQITVESRFEATIPKFHSGSLTNWATQPCVWLELWGNFLLLLQCHLLFSFQIYFWPLLSQSPPLFLSKFYTNNHISVTEWTDTCDIHGKRILAVERIWRMPVFLIFESMITEYIRHQSQLCTTSPISTSFSGARFCSDHCHYSFNGNFVQVIILV